MTQLALNLLPVRVKVDGVVGTIIGDVFPSRDGYHGAMAIVRFEGEWAMGGHAGCEILVDLDEMEAA